MNRVLFSKQLPNPSPRRVHIYTFHYAAWMREVCVLESTVCMRFLYRKLFRFNSRLTQFDNFTRLNISSKLRSDCRESAGLRCDDIGIAFYMISKYKRAKTFRIPGSVHATRIS